MITVIAQRVPFPPNKGEKLRTYHHIKQIVGMGKTVVVYSLEHEPSDQELANALAKDLNIQVTLFPLANKLWRYLNAFVKGIAVSESAFYSPALQQQINQHIANDELTTLYLSASSLAAYAFHCTEENLANVTLIMDFMDVDSDKWQQYAQTSSWPLKWIYRRESKKIRALEQDIVKRFTHTFLIADAEIALFAKTVSNSNPVTRLGNGMDFDAFYPGDDTARSGEPSFLFTGVMDYKPNVDAVVWFVEECWPSIKQQISDAQFIIAGMNPTPQVQSLTKHEGVMVTGFVDDILPYYHSAWAFVAPFRLARGVQNKVLQASACNLPIITTPMGAEGIQFASSATMYLAQTSEQFCESCINVIQQQDQAKTIANAAYSAITSTYSWEHQLMPLVKAITQ